MPRRLFLASAGLSALPRFLATDPHTLRLWFVSTGENPLPPEQRTGQADLSRLREMGFTVDVVDVATASASTLDAVIESADVLFVQGGTCFYLLEQLRESGLAQRLPKFLDAGKVYAGVSGGAMVIAPTVEPWAMTSTEDPPSRFEALGLVDFLVLPHYDTRVARYQPLLDRYGDHIQLLPLRDDEAVLVEGPRFEVVTSP